MLIRASAFAVGKDFDRPPGALLQSEGTWFIRAKVKDREDVIDVAIAVSGDKLGTVQYLDNPSSCVHLADGMRVEYRVAGAIDGPGKPPVGALAWSVDGKEQAIALPGRFLTFEGTESKSCNRERAFFARIWGAWLVDEEGKDLSREPLFFNEIADARGVAAPVK